ncbi:MAG: alanine racemase [Alteromonadaceae bacterium]|nr:alanine racemase [Alteromonadaceae bacterium]
MSLRTATAVIDCQALVKNFQLIKKMSPNSKVLAVLKANAYGHGLERIATTLIQKNVMADAFGVARIDEALVLRAAGIVKPIVLLEGFFSPDDLPILAVNNLQTIVHNEDQLHAILQADLDKPLKVWLKIDTGMHRLGINPDEFQHYYQSLSKSKNVQEPLILMSHLACADEEGNELTAQQMALFDQLTRGLNEERSVANSAAIFTLPPAQNEWIRPGLMLYGVSPLPLSSKNANCVELEPVMTLQSSLISVRKLKAGEFVGYGSAWRSKKETMIGVVAIGYGDGYPRHAQNGTPVLINNRRVPLIGRVSMDMITVDLGLNAQDKVGDCAILWGKQLPVEEIAEYATTIPYELLCNITRRVQIEVV